MAFIQRLLGVPTAELRVEDKPTVPTTERFRHGLEVPKPVATLKFILSPFVPKVKVFPPCPEIRELSSKIRSDGEPTSPMYTLPWAARLPKPSPITTFSAAEEVSILKSVLLAVPAYVVVAIVQANDELFLSVVVAFAEVKSRSPPVMDKAVVEA